MLTFHHNNSGTTPAPQPVVSIDYAAPVGEHLLNGERLVWHGRTRQGVILRLSDILLVPFSLVWCHGVYQWERRAVQAGCVALVGVPFILIGLYLLVGRFVLDVWQRRNTWYGLTERGRAVIVSGRPGRGVVSFDLRQIR